MPALGTSAAATQVMLALRVGNVDTRRWRHPRGALLRSRYASMASSRTIVGSRPFEDAQLLQVCSAKRDSLNLMQLPIAYLDLSPWQREYFALSRSVCYRTTETLCLRPQPKKLTRGAGYYATAIIQGYQHKTRLRRRRPANTTLPSARVSLPWPTSAGWSWRHSPS